MWRGVWSFGLNASSREECERMEFRVRGVASSREVAIKTESMEVRVRGMA